MTAPIAGVGSCIRNKMVDRKWREMASPGGGNATAPPKDVFGEDRCQCKRIFNANCRRMSLFLLLRIEGNLLVSLAFFVAAILCMCGDAGAQYAGMVEQKFAMEPQDQTAIVGSRVTLPCRVIGKSGVLQWTKDDFGLGAHRNLSGYERYSMIGSDEEGDFSLDMFPVQLEDDAKYQCQVSPGPLGQTGIRSRFAALSVLVPPEPPRILQGNELLATEDREVELECISVGGKPAAEITWIDGFGGVVGALARYSSELLPDGRRHTARSVLKMVPRRKHHNSALTCQAQNTADRTFRAASITLKVRYAPVVSVKILSGAATNGRIPEGAEVRLGCSAEANPNELTYRWFLNDELVIGDYTTEMIIFNVSRKLHDSIVKCEVHNAVGKSEESETLDVTYGPRFRSPPSSLEADLGSAVTLTCDLDGNPPPEIIWHHEDQDRWSVVGSTPNLTLTVDTSTAGKYNCKASVMGFPEIEAEAVIYLKGPPSIVSHRTQLGVAGDNARIECRAVAVPKPTAVSWIFNGKEINTNVDMDYSILEDLLVDGVMSTLVIRESEEKHFGLYNCSVTNEYGTDVVEINLMPQSTLPILTIVLGGVVIVIVIIVVAIILVFCLKKRRSNNKASRGKRPDVMADADGKGSVDRTSYISDHKLDLNKHVEDKCNPEYSSQEYRTGVPLAGPVTLPADRAALLMQYSRYSNDYSDHAFPPNHEFKDGHNNNGYSGYIDFSREYSPPPLPLHIQSPVLSGLDSHPANRIQLSSLQSSNQLNSHLSPLSGSLPRNPQHDIQNGANSNSQNSSLRRGTSAVNDPLNSVGLPTPQGIIRTLGSATYDGGMMLQPNGGLKQNGGSILAPNGIDIRYAATYGNPYLRSAGGLTVNTANPAATPAPPPYNSIRNSVLNMVPSGSNSHISPSTIGGGGGVAQPQAAPQSPHAASQYILPPSSAHPAAQMVQLTKKGSGAQQSLATHV